MDDVTEMDSEELRALLKQSIKEKLGYTDEDFAFLEDSERMAEARRIDLYNARQMGEIYRRLRAYITAHDLPLIPNVLRIEGLVAPVNPNLPEDVFYREDEARDYTQIGWWDRDNRQIFRFSYDDKQFKEEPFYPKRWSRKKSKPEKSYAPLRVEVSYCSFCIRDVLGEEPVYARFLEVWIFLNTLNDAVMNDIFYFYRSMFGWDEDIPQNSPNIKLTRIRVPHGDLWRFYTILGITMELRYIKFWRHPIYWLKLWLLRLRRRYLPI